jgi:hypothetical protein
LFQFSSDNPFILSYTALGHSPNHEVISTSGISISNVADFVFAEDENENDYLDCGNGFTFSEMNVPPPEKLGASGATNASIAFA